MFEWLIKFILHDIIKDIPLSSIYFLTDCTYCDLKELNNYNVEILYVQKLKSFHRNIIKNPNNLFILWFTGKRSKQIFDLCNLIENSGSYCIYIL